MTSSRGSGAGTICPALAADGSFALIWSPGSSFTVNLAALAPAKVRARWWDWGRGSFTTIGTFANSGTRQFTAPSYRILVLDAA